MKKCETCSHWQSSGASYPEYGECKESSPIISPLLIMFRGGLVGDWSPVTQSQNTFWPVTNQDEYCDRWTD